MGVALAVVDRPGLQVRLRHPEALLELAVDALDRAVQGDEPVPLDRGQHGDGPSRVGDLLVDAMQRPAGPVGVVLVTAPSRSRPDGRR